MKTKAILLLVSFFSLVNFGLARAEESVAPPVSADSKMTMVANTNIYDAKITNQSGSSLDIRFDLANEDDKVQSGIRYYIELVEEKKQEISGKENLTHHVVDFEVYSETISLYQGQKITKDVHYEAPKYLKGNYQLWIKAQTVEGMMLSLNMAGNVALDGSNEYIKLDPSACYLKVEGDNDKEKKYYLREGVSLKPEELLVVYCGAKNNTNKDQNIFSDFETKRRTYIGEEIETVEENINGQVTFKNGEEKEIYFKIPKAKIPQAYDAVFTLKDEKGMVISNKITLHYVLAGKSATIQNLRLDKDAYGKGDVANVSFFWSASADNFRNSRLGAGTKLDENEAQIKITGENGIVCGETSKRTEGDIFEVAVSIINNCTNPKVEARIIENGNVLASVVNEISSQEKGSNESATKNASSVRKNLFTVIVVLIVLLMILLVIKKRKMYKGNNSSFSVFIFFIFLISFVFFNGEINQAEAATFVSGGYEFVYNLNKTSFGPGEFSIPYALYHSNYCSNASKEGGANVTINGSTKSLINASIGQPDDWGIQLMSVQNVPGSYSADFVFMGTVDWFDEWGVPHPVLATLGTASINYTVALAAPTISGSCNASNTVTLAWNQPSGAAKYALGVDADSPSWNGGSAPDILQDPYFSTSYIFSGTPGRSYRAWVYAATGSNIWSSVSNYVNFSCPVATCTGTAPNGTTQIMCPSDNTGLVSSTAWLNVGATSSSCTDGRKCEYYTPAAPTCSITFTKAGLNIGESVNVSYTSTNASTLSYVCTGPVPGTNPSAPLSGSGTHTPLVSGTENCNVTVTGPGGSDSCSGGYVVCGAGFTWNGSVCQAVAPNSCQSSIPANASAWDAEESSSLANNTTNWTYSASDTATKCQYQCNGGYSWNGSSCQIISAVINGSCGLAAQVYAYDAVAYAGAYCSAGSASSTPAFPAQGASVSWNCVGSSGGTTANCAASRNNPPACVNAPTATIIQPISTQTINTGSSVNFQGIGSDPDPGDTIVAYEWRLNDCNTGNFWSDAQTFTPTFNVAGTYDLYLRVQDSSGCWSTNCPTRRIIVNPPPSVGTIDAAPPTITINQDVTVSWNAGSNAAATVCYRVNGGPYNKLSSWQGSAVGSRIYSNLSVLGTWEFSLFDRDSCLNGFLDNALVTVNPAGCIPSCTAWSACVAGNQTRSCTRADCSIDIETQVCCLPSHVCVSPACAGLCGVQNDYCQPICGGDCTGVICSGTVTCPPCNSGNWQEIAP